MAAKTLDHQVCRLHEATPLYPTLPRGLLLTNLPAGRRMAGFPSIELAMRSVVLFGVLMLVCLMVANCASRDGADSTMMTCHVTCRSADDGSFNTSLCVSRGDDHRANC
jgi:hypothetical protein